MILSAVWSWNLSRIQGFELRIYGFGIDHGAGHEAAHVEDAGLRGGGDRAIWAHAQQTAGPVIVWLRVGNTTNRALRAWLEPRLPGIIGLVGQGHRLVEVV